MTPATLNTRLREVLARPLTTTLLYELWLESPRGACVACWRDVGCTERDGAGIYFCNRGGSGSPCESLRRRIARVMHAAQQRAKWAHVPPVVRVPVRRLGGHARKLLRMAQLAAQEVRP